jgi:hypothetical protein
VGTGSGGTAADYEAVAADSDRLLADARSAVPDDAVVREELTVTDLDEDRHRLTCDDRTSQYTNYLTLWLAEGTDEIAIIDALREDYEAEGWARGASVEEQAGDAQDPEGRYIQTMRSPSGFGLSISRGNDVDGTTLLQFAVYSPCVPNPTDKSKTWGL